MTREFHKVGVVGLGTMGAGIAEVFARNGLAVIAVEVDEGALDAVAAMSRTPPDERSRAASCPKPTTRNCSSGSPTPPT